MVLAHGGELVLSATETQTFERIAYGGASQPIHVHFDGNTIHGSAGQNFADQLNAHEDRLVHKMKSLQRDGKLSFAGN